MKWMVVASVSSCPQKMWWYIYQKCDVHTDGMTPAVT